MSIGGGCRDAALFFVGLLCWGAETMLLATVSFRVAVFLGDLSLTKS